MLFMFHILVNDVIVVTENTSFDMNTHLLLLLRLLSQHGRHLCHQLERRSRLNGVQAHVGAGQVLHLAMLGAWLGRHLLLLDWSCNKRMACRSVQHRCTVHVHWNHRFTLCII